MRYIIFSWTSQVFFSHEPTRDSRDHLGVRHGYNAVKPVSTLAFTSSTFLFTAALDSELPNIYARELGAQRSVVNALDSTAIFSRIRMHACVRYSKRHSSQEGT